MSLSELLLTNKRKRDKNGINLRTQQRTRACCITQIWLSNILALISHFIPLVPLSFPSGFALVLFYPVFLTHLFVLTLPLFFFPVIFFVITSSFFRNYLFG